MKIIRQDLRNRISLLICSPAGPACCLRPTACAVCSYAYSIILILICKYFLRISVWQFYMSPMPFSYCILTAGCFSRRAGSPSQKVRMNTALMAS